MTSGTNYDKWNKLTKTLVNEVENEDKIEREVAAESLGQNRASYSEAEAEEKAKAAIARKAKEALDKQQERESNAIAYLENLISGKEGTESFKDVVVDEAKLGAKRVVSIKNNFGPGKIILPSNLSNLPITSAGEKLGVHGVIKVFIEDCHECTVHLECKIITSTVEITNCSNLNVIVDLERVATFQVDLCEGINITFLNRNLFGRQEDKIYHAGVSNMKVSIMDGETKMLEKTMDYLSDGAVAKLNASPEEYQFMTSVINNRLCTEHLMRIGNKSVTQREIDEENRMQGKHVVVNKKGLSALQISDLIQQCYTHKGEGNDAFKTGEYAQAVLFYSMAIDKSTGLDKITADFNGTSGNSKVDPFTERHIIFANRSACFLKLGHHEKALADADACLELESNYVKGLFRKGLALHALKRYREAIDFLAKAIKIEPKNKQIKQALQFAEVKLTMDLRKRMEG